MDEGKSRSFQEEGEALRAQKKLKIGHQGRGKEVDAQPMPQAWLPAPMLHGEPLTDNASLRDFQGGEGAYVANALESTLLLPTDMDELRNLRRQEVFLNIKRYLGMVRFLTLANPLISAPRSSIYRVFVSMGRLSRPPIGWKRMPKSRANPWNLR